MMVVLLGIFWDDLTSRRTMGRKLTEILLEKVDLVWTRLVIRNVRFKSPRKRRS
jgi:hypothetical protein